MAAAAACRGSTDSHRKGNYQNVVIPGESNKDCANVCLSTKYKNCDASVSISGTVKHADKSYTPVGYYHNYQCSGPSWGEEHAAYNEDILTGRIKYFTYCCCRK